MSISEEAWLSEFKEFIVVHHIHIITGRINSIRYHLAVLVSLVGFHHITL